MVEYLNYQNTDLAKSLLLFSKEEKINLSDNIAIEFLKIYGANCFGNGLDKKPFLERVK
jgi:DNA-directed RNA polymerase